MARRLGTPAITLIVIDAVLIVVLAGLLFTQPDGAADAPSDDASSPAETTPSETAEPSSTQAVTAPADALDVAEFVTPSGNIWCTLDDTSATCQISDIDFQPTSIDGCDSDLAGRVVTVTDEGPEYPCPSGDGIAGAAPGDREVLAYDQTTAVGSSMCRSAEDGVTCTNLTTGTSFSVRRAGLELNS